MGHKYEVLIWVRRKYQHEYNYDTVQYTNNLFKALLAMFRHRKNGCVTLKVRR